MLRNLLYVEGVIIMQDNKLKSFISLRGYTIDRLAKEIGVSTANLSAKLNGKRQFKMNDAKNISRVLHIENPVDIFFTP